MTYYGLAGFLSIVSKRTTQSVIIGVFIWALFTFVVPVVASTVASALVPIEFRPRFTNTTMIRPGQNVTGPSQYEVSIYIDALRRAPP